MTGTIQRLYTVGMALQYDTALFGTDLEQEVYIVQLFMTGTTWRLYRLAWPCSMAQPFLTQPLGVTVAQHQSLKKRYDCDRIEHKLVNLA